MHRWSITALACAVFFASLSAQSTDPAELFKKANEQAVFLMKARAQGLAEQKQFARALALRRELVGELASGDEQTMTELGFVMDASGFHRDANKLVFDKDIKGDLKAIKKLDQDWEKVQKELAKAYEKAAEALSAAGQPEQAMLAWQRLARFRPGDAKAAVAMQLLGFDGITGTADDLNLLRRSRAIRLAVEYLTARTVPIQPIKGRQHPVLEKAKVAAQGFATEHFEFWGTIPADKLQLAAQWAERSLLLSRTLMPIAEGQLWSPRSVRSYCWVDDRATYQQIVTAHASQLGAKERLRFLCDDVELCFLQVGSSECRLLLNKSKADDELLDQTVRGVLQDALQLTADGLWEGVGHAICGMCFGKTLTFFIEQAKGRTVTSWQARPLMPDIKVWMEIATESAWAKSDSPTSRIAVLSGAKFTNEERVKAWAICDYLFRVRPDLLVELAASRLQGNTDPVAVEAEFRRRTRIDLKQIDQDWRKYWGNGGALRVAAAAPLRGSKNEVAAAKAIAIAINDARATALRGPIGYYVPATAAVKVALTFAEALAQAQKQAQQVPKVEVVAPPEPECVGRTVLLHLGVDPAAAVAEWLIAIGARDALLHPGRILIGASMSKLAIVLDLAEPATRPTTGLPVAWPRHLQSSVPAACRVQQLPQWLQEQLLAHGKQPADLVGMPLSLHFARELLPTEIPAVTCRLVSDHGELAGVFACAQRDGRPSDVAPGCFVFVPLEPLPKNRELSVEWTVPPSLLTKREKFAPISFALQ